MQQHKVLKYSFPSIDDVECQYCDKTFDVDGEEFEKAMSMDLYATAMVTCPFCEESFTLNIG